MQCVCTTVVGLDAHEEEKRVAKTVGGCGMGEGLGRAGIIHRFRCLLIVPFKYLEILLRFQRKLNLGQQS